MLLLTPAIVVIDEKYTTFFVSQFLYMLTAQVINEYSKTPIQVRKLCLRLVFLYLTWLRMEKVERNVGSHCKVTLRLKSFK